MWPLFNVQCSALWTRRFSALCFDSYCRKENGTGKRRQNEWYFFDESFDERRQKDDAQTRCVCYKRKKYRRTSILMQSKRPNEQTKWRSMLLEMGCGDGKRLQGKWIILLMCELFTNYGVCCTPVHVLWFLFCSSIIEMSWFPKLTSPFTNAHSLALSAIRWTIIPCVNESEKERTRRKIKCK